MNTSTAMLETNIAMATGMDRVAAQFGADRLLADRLLFQRGGKAAGVEHADDEIDFGFGEIAGDLACVGDFATASTGADISLPSKMIPSRPPSFLTARRLVRSRSCSRRSIRRRTGPPPDRNGK